MDIPAIINSVFPLFSLVVARVLSTTPYKFDKTIPYVMYIWIFIAIVTGFAGYDVAKVNDQLTCTLFLLLAWFFGNGYILVNSFRNPVFPFVYSACLFLLSSIIFERLHNFDKPLGRTAMIPSIIWSMFLIIMTVANISTTKNLLLRYN